MSIKTDGNTAEPLEHPYLRLRQQLPSLQFDPAQDVPVPAQPFLQDYLHFYQLDIPTSVCRNHCMGTMQSDEYTIVVHYFLPAMTARGTVFVLHGYYDHVGTFHHLIRFLLEQGFAVIAYDQPGHGLSSGERASINHFSEYVHVLQQCIQKAQKLPTPWFAIGQSTGGAVLVHGLLEERMANPFRAIVLLAPLLKPVGWDRGKWFYYLIRPFVKGIPRHFSQNSHDMEFVQFSHYQDPLQAKTLSVTWTTAMKEWLERFPRLAPITVHGLLIQGDEDHTVAWHYNLPMIKQKVQGLEVTMIPGGRHHLVNESPELRTGVFARIREFLLASA